MVAGMVFLIRNNYLSRIGALWPMPINDHLKLSDTPAALVGRRLIEDRFRTR
jgi:hypothetical protein